MKQIIASLIFLISTTVFADPAPFGLEIGKTTVADAEKIYRIEKIGTNELSKGPIYNIAVNQVDFEGLKELTLTFNEKSVLAMVSATLPKSQFKSLHESLSKKYKVVMEKIPFVGDSAVEYADGSTVVLLVAPHLSLDMELGYINKDLHSGGVAKAKAENAAKKKSQEDKL